MMTGFTWLAAITAMHTQAGTPTLSISDAVQQSLAHSDTIKAAAARYRAAQARVGAQASRGKIQLGTSASATRFDNKTNVSLGGTNLEILPTHQETLGAELSLDLDVTGQIATAVSQAKLNALASGYDLKARTSDQALDASIAYYTVLRAREAVKVAQAALDSYKEQLKTTSQLQQQGVGLKLDVLRAESQVADAERELVRRQNDLHSATSALNDQMGVDLDRSEEFGDATFVDVETTSLDRPALIAKALSQRAEILESSVNVAATQKGVKLARADAEPVVGVNIGGNYYPTTSFQYVRHATAEATINVRFSVLDGGLAKSLTREAKANVDAAVAEQSQVKRAVSLQVQNAALDVETARKRLASAKAAVEAAEGARKLAQQRYAGQVAQYIEVTDAQAALTAAQGSQVDAYYDLLIARARLDRAVGDWAPDSSTTPQTNAQRKS
jgi:outer membrane protein TolC